MLSFLFEKRSAENPKKPLTNLNLLNEDSDTSSGVHVSEKSAMQLSAVYTSINVIAKTVAMLPIQVKE